MLLVSWCLFSLLSKFHQTTLYNILKNNHDARTNLDPDPDRCSDLDYYRDRYRC